MRLGVTEGQDATINIPNTPSRTGRDAAIFSNCAVPLIRKVEWGGPMRFHRSGKSQMGGNKTGADASGQVGC